MTKFKDMKIGDRFECWGDYIGLYDTPKDCLVEKDTWYSVVEIVNGIKTNYGVCVGLDDEYVVIKSDPPLGKPD